MAGCTNSRRPSLLPANISNWPMERKITCCVSINETLLGLCGKALVVGSRGYRVGFCKKLLEASPVFDRANASQLQYGPTAGQG